MTGAAVPLPAAPNGFLLQRVQPALSGLIDGSLSSLAPNCGRNDFSACPRAALLSSSSTFDSRMPWRIPPCWRRR